MDFSVSLTNKNFLLLIYIKWEHVFFKNNYSIEEPRCVLKYLILIPLKIVSLHIQTFASCGFQKA